MQSCTIEDCDKPYRARGYCSGHYKRAFPSRKAAQCVVCSATVMQLQDARFKPTCSEKCRDINRHTGKAPIECVWCGTLRTVHNGLAQYCGAKCSRAANRVKRRALEHNAPGSYTLDELHAKHRANNYRCTYCNEYMAKPTADHIVPLTKGGSNSIDNINACCKECNSSKNNQDLNVWLCNGGRGVAP